MRDQDNQTPTDLGRPKVVAPATTSVKDGTATKRRIPAPERVDQPADGRTRTRPYRC